ncbi:hypothetical protein C2845_PM13G06700 [Panicum miliaceum]|uniref:Uncharacterized protein n=1 Tax=Panicum miliaceum TaxID=4540 RepID=A0A3L6RHS0_PANMI|nr:hypothetical protein C2845_PM13G06700 [Panicum miliaceum]
MEDPKVALQGLYPAPAAEWPFAPEITEYNFFKYWSTSIVVVIEEKMAAAFKEEKAADNTAGNGFQKVQISVRMLDELLVDDAVLLCKVSFAWNMQDELTSLLDVSNEIQESLVRSYNIPDDVDEELAGLPKKQRQTKAALMMYIAWNVWKERNRHI